MARNEKGQFLPGNKEGHKIQRGGDAAEKARAATRSRIANLHGRELLREMLKQKVQDPAVVEAMKKRGYKVADITNELAMNERQIEKAQKTGDTKAYGALMRVAGYDEQNVNLTADATIALTLADPSALDGLKAALSNGAAPRKPDGE